MTLQNAALVVAGLIGSGVAIVHGVLVKRLMVARLQESSPKDVRAPESIRRLMPLLLQFSTFNWVLGGLALIGAAVWLERDAVVAIGVLVGSSYLYGALANFWATRGRHPGWMLYAVALILVVFGVV